MQDTTCLTDALSVQNGPAVSLYLTLFGIVAGFVSTFWSFGYTRLARRLRGYLEGGLRRVRKNDVVYTLQNGCWINILGIISTLLGLQVIILSACVPACLIDTACCFVSNSHFNTLYMILESCKAYP